MPLLFPFAEYWWFYLAFTAFILFLLALDLGVFHREAHEVKFKEALSWCVVWVALALLFNVALYYYMLWKLPLDPRLNTLPGFDAQAEAWRVALEYLTGFIVEKSLAIDNVFVFVVVFTYFAIPPKYQHRVLFYGILGALVFRVIFIALGSVLLAYEPVVWFFGALLIATGIKIFFAPSKAIEPEKNPIIKLVRKFLPVTTEHHGQSFFVRQDGRLFATPLFMCLVFLELSDIIFAVDSVPAIFAITKEPFIVFTSNVFAILGLRAMYFLLADVMHRFYYLKYALGVILVFVGLKMVWLNHAFGGKFPISWSLSFIGVVLGTAILLSWVKGRKISAINA